MTIFRFSLAAVVLIASSCGSATFRPRNEVEVLLQGNVNDVIAALETYIAQHSDDPKKLESDLIAAGFSKGVFRNDASEEDTIRTNCQFYNYRRKGGPSGFGASAVVWVCETGSGANFGYIAP